MSTLFLVYGRITRRAGCGRWRNVGRDIPVLPTDRHFCMLQPLLTCKAAITDMLGAALSVISELRDDDQPVSNVMEKNAQAL